MLSFDSSDGKWNYQHHVRVIFHVHAFLVIIVLTSSVLFYLHNEYVLRQNYKKYDSLDETAKQSLFKDFKARFDRTVIVILSLSTQAFIYLLYIG